MNQLITITKSAIGNDVVQTVNARELHAELEVGKDFSTWVKAQIVRARLVEDRDYVTVTQKGDGGKFAPTEYHLTLEAAKHIAMLSNTDKGFEVREYFLECERKAALPLVQNPVLQALIAQVAEIDRIEQQQKALAVQQQQIATRLDAVENRVATQDTDFFTVLGYSKRIGEFVDNVRASVLGRKATKLSNEREYPMGKATDPRFGSVHTYHIDILQEVFA